MSTEMAQMNTRISRSLKERGDAALEKAGMTPSQAVRKLWDADVLRFHFRSSRHHPVSNHQTHSDICAARSINCRSCWR